MSRYISIRKDACFTPAQGTKAMESVKKEYSAFIPPANNGHLSSAGFFQTFQYLIRLDINGIATESFNVKNGFIQGVFSM